jgi:hypothetical protein
MPQELKEYINDLCKTSFIASRPKLVKQLMDINKLAENNSEKAYLLGLFVKNKIDNRTILDENINELIRIIKNENLKQFYYLKRKPTDEKLKLFSIIFIPVGIVGVFAGIVQLSKGNFNYGLGTKYLVPIIREGGYKVILGLILCIGGLLRLKHELQKRTLLKNLLSRNCI